MEIEGSNNLAFINIHLISKALKEEFNIHRVLDNIIIKRAFTFYQLANIIINEIPEFIDKLGCGIQIIVVDILKTLFSSSSVSSNKKEGSDLKNFKENEKLLNEIVDNLIHISDKHFAIVSYNDVNNIIKRTITCKFKNIIELDKITDIVNRKKQSKDLSELQSKIESFATSSYNEILN